MQILRIKSTADSGSQFDILDVPLPDSYDDGLGHRFLLSRAFDAEGVVVQVPAGVVQDLHPAPRRQLVVVLAGTLEVETTEAEVRSWGPGEMLLADDVASRGHRSRALDGPLTLLYLRLPEAFQLEDWIRG